MKVFSVLALLLLASTLPVFADWRADYERLLSTFVKADGVNYKGLKNSPEAVAALKAVTEGIAAEPVSKLKRDDQLAFYINAYNAWMLQLVVENYPLKSVRDIAPLFGAFTGKRINVGGERMSLNHLEKQIIIKKFKEPRIHFAINCASASCPPLMNFIYTGKDLDRQLNQVTRAFADTKHAAIIDGNNVAVSKIFEWYSDDFKPAGGPIAYLNQYRSNRVPKIPQDARVQYQEYDWALNETGR